MKKLIIWMMLFCLFANNAVPVLAATSARQDNTINQEAEVTQVDDMTAPIIDFDTLKVSSKQVTSGEVVQISVQAEEANPIIGTAAGVIKHSVMNAPNKHTSLYYNSETNNYEGQVYLNENEQSQVFHALSLSLQDAKGNIVNYAVADSGYEGEIVDLSNADFEFTNSNQDIEAPIADLNSLVVDVQTVNQNEYHVTVGVQVSDNIQISGGSLVYTSDKGSRILSSFSYNSLTQKQETTFSVIAKENVQEELFTIESLSFSDAYQTTKYVGINADSWIEGERVDLTQGNFTVMNAQSTDDQVGPEIDLSTLKVNRTIVPVGEQVTLSVAVSDQSQITTGEACYAGSRNSGYHCQNFEYNTQTQQYDAVFTISEYSPSQSYYLEKISFSDDIMNTTTYYRQDNPLGMGDFEVVNTDEQGPEVDLSTLSIDKQVVSGNEIVTVSISATDASAISSASVDYHGSKEGYRHGSFNLNEATGKYEAKIIIPETARNEKYTIGFLNFSDQFGNSTEYRGLETNWGEGIQTDLSAGDFEIVNPNADEEGPEVDLSTLSVDKQVVGVNETVTISVIVTDKSAINYGDIRYRGSKGGYHYGSFNLNEVTGKYEATITIPETARNEKYTIESLSFNDSVNNRVEYIGLDNTGGGGIQVDLSAGDFEAVNPNADEVAPEVDLNTLSVDKQIVGGNEVITVSVVATDTTGISHGSINYCGSKGGYHSANFEFNEITGKHEAKIVIPEIARNEKYTIESLYFSDYFNNRTEYRGLDTNWGEGIQTDLSAGDFEVVNPNADEEGPEVDLSTLSVDKQVVAGNEIVTVSVVAVDTTGVNYGGINYRGSKGTYQWRSFSFNEMTGNYEAKITISEAARNEKYTIESLYFHDNLDNRTEYIGLDNYWGEGIRSDLSAGDFEVVNPNADEEGPEIDLSTLSIDKQVVGGNEVVTVSVMVTDTSGVSHGGINYKGNQGFEQWGTFSFNEATGKYEAQIGIAEYARSEKYIIDSVYFYDNNNIETYYSGEDYDLSSGDFEVINPSQDITAPTVDNDSIRVGFFDNRLHLIATVSDTESGVTFAEAVYQTEYGKQTIYTESIDNMDKENTIVYLPLPISESTLTQNYQLLELTVYDENQNKTYLNRTEVDLSGGDYQHIQSQELLSIPVDELIFLDRNKNGIKESSEPGITGQVYGMGLESLDNAESYPLSYQKGAHTLQVNNLPNGTYKITHDIKYNFYGQLTSEAVITVEGQTGQQSVTINTEMGIYQDGTTVEIHPNFIYLDENNNGIQEASEVTYHERKKLDIAGQDAYETYVGIYLENEIGKRYEIGMPGKGGEDTRMFIFDPETGKRVFLPHGRYQVVTDLARKTITTPTEVVIDETNDSDLIHVVASIGIGNADSGGKPIFHGVDDVTIKIGTDFDPLAGVTVTDAEDGNIYKYGVEGTVDVNKVGVYTLTYIANDSDSNTTSVNRVITVKSNQKPQIHGADNFTLPVGTEFKPLEGVTASDAEDGDVTHAIEMSGVVNRYQLGDYVVTYTVMDSDGNRTSLERIVSVDYTIPTDWTNNWASPYIRQAMEKGWVTTSDTFRPEDNITRAEFVKVVNKAFGYTEPAASEPFGDVKEPHWFYQEILIAVQAGYISTSMATFRPNETITREEVAAIITNIKGNKDTDFDKIQQYSDYNEISSWARDSVEGVVEAGYMGRGSDKFRPKSPISRAEAVVTLGRVFE